MSAPTPSEACAQVVNMWEGGYQSYRDDLVNWVYNPADPSQRRDIGTMRGVSPAALAAHRGVSPWSLTVDDMKSVSLDEAVDIGYKHYYLDPKLDLLPWGPATCSVFDFGWGSGPFQAIISTQRLVGAGADGVMGSNTKALYTQWEAALGWVAATSKVHDMREAFYRMLAMQDPDRYEQFLQGWLNRDNWMSQANPTWWDQWGVS